MPLILNYLQFIADSLGAANIGADSTEYVAQIFHPPLQCPTGFLTARSTDTLTVRLCAKASKATKAMGLTLPAYVSSITAAHISGARLETDIFVLYSVAAQPTLALQA